MLTFTRKKYIEVWCVTGSERYISRHTSIVEAAESASEDAEEYSDNVIDYEARVGDEVWYEMSIRRLLTDRSLRALAVVPAVPPLNNPPVWNSQPNVNFVDGVASNFELQPLVTDPDGDPVTISLNTGAVSLPTGVTWNDTLDRLEYDGVGAVDTTTGHIATADDGTNTTDTSAFSVVIATAGSQTLPGFPLMTAGFAIGNGRFRRTIEPSKTNFASKNLAIHQMILFSNESERRARHLEWQGMVAINPNQVHVPHIDFHGIDFDPSSSAGATDAWFDHLVHADSSNFDNWIGKINPTFYSMQSFDNTLSFRWDAPEYVHTQVATRMWQDWSNFDDSRTYAEGGANLARDFKFGIMQDTFAQNASNVIQWYPEYQGEVTARINDNELQIDAWTTGAGQISNYTDHFAGTPDGAGYTPNSHTLQIIVMEANHSNSYSDKITGHQINGGNHQIRIDGTANFTPAVGDKIWVKVRQGETSATQRTSNIWDRDTYHDRGIFNLETVSGLNQTNYGISTGIYSNQVSQNYNIKKLGGADALLMPVAKWLGKWDGLHWEHAEEQMGFTSDSAEIGYWVKNSLHGRNTQDYDPNDIASAIAANRPLLKSNEASANKYPCIWLNCEHVRKLNFDATGFGVEQRYAALDELDAAFVRFWSLLCWCCENMAVQAEMYAHADPVMIDEEVIEAGNPITARDWWENYDPTGNDGRGTYDWKTPDFGTHGYWFEFDNMAIQINFRVPDDINIAWIPSWMEGGQPIDPEKDRMVLPYAGDGFEWRAFDRVNYVNTSTDPTNTYYGKSPTDYDATYILKDEALNHGGPRGVYFDTGPLEGVVHMRVPVTVNPVSVDTTNNRFFSYKGRPIQLFGHQHIRINVDQATEKDMPAVMGSEASPVAGALDTYMDLVAQRGMNHIRLWPYFTSDSANAVSAIASPLPWARTGGGTAGDGGARFDLDTHNQTYFDRIDAICQAALERDIIVTVLVWDVYSFQGTRQPYNPMTNVTTQNNINSIETNANANSRGLDAMYEGTIPSNIETIQIAYEEKLIDTVNAYPNIIFEVLNEAGRLPFQTDCMARIRAYEAGLANQHLVAISAGGLLDSGTYTKTDVGKTAVKATTCDFIMPGTDQFSGTWGDTDDSSGTGPPLQVDTTRPWVIDMDHIEPGARRPDHFWKCLTRGYGYNHFESNSTSDPVLSQPYSTLYWEAYMRDTTYGFNIIRRNIGTGRDWVNNQTLDPSAMTPTDGVTVASSTYCLADPGEDYIIFLPSGTSVTVEQLVSGQTYRYKWWDTTLGVEEPGTATLVSDGQPEVMTAPFTLGAHGAALHIWKIS